MAVDKTFEVKEEEVIIFLSDPMSNYRVSVRQIFEVLGGSKIAMIVSDFLILLAALLTLT